MNAERLHVIALAIRGDLQETKADKTLEQLVAALQNQVNQPADPRYQQQVSSHVITLYSAFKRAKQ